MSSETVTVTPSEAKSKTRPRICRYDPGNLPTTMASRNVNKLSVETNLKNTTAVRDVMAKETVGLPVFISDQGEMVTSATAEHHRGSITSPRRESILSPKRLSSVFDFAISSAVNSVDGLYKQAQALLLEDQPPRHQPERNDLESGGSCPRQYGEDTHDDWLD